MADDRPPPDLPDLWQNQPVDPVRLVLADLREQARQFEKTIARRNLFEYLTALFVVAFFGWYALAAEGIAARLGAALIVLGTLAIAYRLHTRGRAQALPSDALASQTAAFYRQELERQRDLLRTFWRWYLGPLIPGLALMLGQSAIAEPSIGHLLKVGVFSLVMGGILFAIARVNQIAASKLDAEIRALEPDEP
jgi:hypothetical protein